MYGEVIDPFGKWADMPEIPEPKQEPKEDDDRAAHVMGCLAVVGALTLFFITIIIFMLV